MKKNQLLALLALAMPMIITSCGESGSSTEPSEDNPYASYKKLTDFDKGVTTYNKNGQELPLNRHLIETNNRMPCLNSTGEQRILVVPLGLEDDTGTSPGYPAVARSGRTEKQTQERLDMIENLFFGEAGADGTQTLKSYYETSSYGQLTITGQVMKCDGGWFRPGKKPIEYNSSKAVSDVRTYYNEEYAKENHGALGADAHEWKWFDQDGDGFIDAMWIVYSAPIHAYETSSTGTNWWAYVTRTGFSADKSKPQPQTYAWASIDFMDKAYGEGKDWHTFVHETGHIFGNDDYYSYDDTEAPLGGIDMQDHNIGDHNSFTKWQWGWTSPYIIDDNAYIEMEPSSTSGQFCIIPSQNFSGACYDEYMMIEFMSPTGLNSEYKTGYEGTVGYTKPGLRITHVDARAYTSKNTEILDTPEKIATATNMRLMNTPSGRGYASWRDTFDNPETGTSRSMFFINIMQASGFSKDNNLLVQRTESTNDDLFTKGFSFDLEPYGDNGGIPWNDWYYFMPSYSNLWNKAQSPATREIDTDFTFDYRVHVLDVNKEKVKFIVEKIA